MAWFTKASPPGGSAIEPGIVARARGAYQAAKDYWFGPEKPQPISAPSGTPPRTFDYPVGYNINIQPRNQEAVSFQQLRNLADSWDLLRLFIQKAGDSVASIPWEFRLKKQPGEKKSEYSKRNLGDTRLGKLSEFFEQPDGEHTWREWVKMALEEAMVIDALSIVPLADIDGALWTNGIPAALEIVDGATISRKINANGRTPKPPAVAYQQIIKGIPAVDFTSEQLIYKPRNPRVHKFFGYSPVEQILMTINIGIRREIHLLQYYTEGNVPEMIAQVPATWSADQIKEFQEWFDSALAGNTAARRRITFVPEVGTVQPTKDPKLKDTLDDWLVRIVAAAFGLSPQQFISMMNRATAQVSVEQAAAEGLMPILDYLKDIVNFIIRTYWKIGDVEFAWQTQSQAANPIDQAKVDDIYVRSGVLSIDEVRDELGKDPIGARNAVITTNGLVPVDTAIENADNPPEPTPQQVGLDGKPVEGNQPPNGKEKPGKKKTAKRDYVGYEANQRPSRK
jgi:hypothetical protein